MRLSRNLMTGVFALLLLLPVARAQEKPRQPVSEKLPATLEGMLEMALRLNPDLALAESRVREAQAELNRTRLSVVQQVATLYHERTHQQKLKDGRASSVARLKQLHDTGRIDLHALAEAALQQAEAEAKLARIEAEIRYLLGVGSKVKVTFGEPASKAAGAARTSAAGRPPLRDHESRMLLHDIKVDWDNLPMTAVLKALQEACDGGLVFLPGPGMDADSLKNLTITLKLPETIRLKSAIVAIADYLREYDLCFVFREYGVVLADRETAEGMVAPTIPENVPLRRP
ncbi:MAG: hypothetical protein ACYTGV_02640 [Planctomycetota bacterium]